MGGGEVLRLQSWFIPPLSSSPSSIRHSDSSRELSAFRQALKDAAGVGGNAVQQNRSCSQHHLLLTLSVFPPVGRMDGYAYPCLRFKIECHGVGW